MRSHLHSLKKWTSIGHLTFLLALWQPDLMAQSNFFVHFPDFSNPAGLTLNGVTKNVNTTNGFALRLVPAQAYQNGSAFISDRVNAAAFSTFFSFRFSAGGGWGGGADGFCFVVQSIGRNVGAGVGGGLGYQGMTNSVAVEFDIYDNGSEANDPNGSHVGIDVGGKFDSAPGQTAPVSPDMKNGDLWFAWIDYDGSALAVRLNRTGVRPNQPTVTRTVDIPKAVNSTTAFVGFTAGTGLGYASHDILSWQFTGTLSPIGIPPQVSLQMYAGLTIAGSIGSTYQVQYLDRLGDTNWLALTNILLPANPVLFIDETSPFAQKRFYRVIQQ